jgi:hypothetical protein
LAREISAVYALGERFGREALLVAMDKAGRVGIYGADYLALLLDPPKPQNAGSPAMPNVPPQAEVDRLLSSYEEWVVGASTTPERAKLLTGVAS